MSAAAPITIHLMRHGATTRPGRLVGRTDCPATPDGIAACVAAAAALSMSAVIASDLARARDCAQPIAELRSLTLRIDPRWRELDFGAWDDCLPSDIEPVAFERFWRNPDADPPPEGERWSALVARVAEAMAALEDATLVVTHGGAMRAALASACGFDARQVWAFDLPYAAVLSLRLWRGEHPAAQIVGLRT